jgi:hypothetical protein
MPVDAKVAPVVDVTNGGLDYSSVDRVAGESPEAGGSIPSSLTCGS